MNNIFVHFKINKCIVITITERIGFLIIFQISCLKNGEENSISIFYQIIFENFKYPKFKFSRRHKRQKRMVKIHGSNQGNLQFCYLSLTNLTTLKTTHLCIIFLNVVLKNELPYSFQNIRKIIHSLGWCIARFCPKPKE